MMNKKQYATKFETLRKQAQELVDPPKNIRKKDRVDLAMNHLDTLNQTEIFIESNFKMMKDITKDIEAKVVISSKRSFWTGGVVGSVVTALVFTSGIFMAMIKPGFLSKNSTDTALNSLSASMKLAQDLIQAWKNNPDSKNMVSHSKTMINDLENLIKKNSMLDDPALDLLQKTVLDFVSTELLPKAQGHEKAGDLEEARQVYRLANNLLEKILQLYKKKNSELSKDSSAQDLVKKIRILQDKIEELNTSLKKIESDRTKKKNNSTKPDKKENYDNSNSLVN